MTTREHILITADKLIRENGYNGFSFFDIAKYVGIKKPSIYHHFPHKIDLGVAVVDYHLHHLNNIKNKYKNKSALDKLEVFFSIHSDIHSENKVCLVGSLAPDYHTLHASITDRLRTFAASMLDWVVEFLEEGRTEGIFSYETDARTKALMIISSMVAIVPISRLTNENDFKLIRDGIKKELLKKQ